MGASIRHLFNSDILPAASHLPPNCLIHIPRQIYESSSKGSPLSKKHLGTQLANAHIAWIALGMYRLTQLTMLTKAKETKSAL